jgi:hypothetical protein
MLRKAPAADGAAAGAADAAPAGAADAAAVPTADGAGMPTADAAAMPTADAAAMPTADAAAPPAVDAAMLHTAPAAGAAAGTPNDQPWRLLSMCDKGLRDAFRDCMSKEKEARMKEMEARLKELDRLQYDLRGFMYLSPHQKLERPVVPEYIQYHISNPGKKHVSLYLEVRLGESDEPWWSTMHTSLDFLFIKVDGHWKLKKGKKEYTQILSHFISKIQITVKHAGSDEWTPVELSNACFSAFNTHKPEDGTNFGHGDQINMRYVDSNGRSYPVSFDGTEATNYFPLTICVIG